MSFHRSKRATEFDRAAWVRSFQEEALRLGAHPGQIKWDDAAYLYGQKISPQDAARRVYGAKTDPRRARRSSRGGSSRGRSRSSPAHDPVSAWQPGVSSPQHFSWNQNGFPVDAWLTTDFRGVTELAVRVRVRDGYQRLAEPYRGSLSSVHYAAKILAQKIIAKAAVSNDPSKRRGGKRKKSGARRARSAQRKGHPTDLVVLMKGAGFPRARAHAERLKTISRRTTVKPIVGDYRGLGSDSRETDAEPGFGRRRRDNRWPDGRYY